MSVPGTALPAGVRPAEAAREAVRRLRRTGISALMPYVYVLSLGLAIYVIEPALIDGPGAIDVRASAVVPLALVAFGQTLNLFTRGIDLSVGGVISVVTAVLASVAVHSGGALWLELVGLVVAGALMGALNGALIAFTGLQPFIVTLGTWSVWGGVALVILPTEGGTVPNDLVNLVLGNIGAIPKSVLVMAVLFCAWWWLRDTRFVRDLRAIGSDKERARLIGVRVGLRTVQCYLFSGVCGALAGIWIAAQAGSGSPTVGDAYILNSVAAVVIGGTSLFGGTGSAAASMVGAIAYLMIPDLVSAVNISSFWSVFLQGFLLIVAVTASSLAVRLNQRRGA